jgi:hypothetical protein
MLGSLIAAPAPVAAAPTTGVQPPAVVPGPTYLADLTTVSGGFGTGSVEIDGTTYGRSIWSRWLSSDETAEYNLGRHYRRFVATIGILDDASTDAASTFELRADGVAIYTRRLTLGQHVVVNVPVTHRLRLAVTLRDNQGGNCRAGWGNARLSR